MFFLILLVSLAKATDLNLDFTSEQTFKCFPQKANILFLIDSSQSSDANNFADLVNRVIPFIIDEFDETLSKFSLSVIIYAKKLTEIMPLHETFDVNLVKAKLAILQQTNQVPNHALALKKSVAVFSDFLDIPNLCLWFTDGNFMQDFKEAISKADKLKSSCHIFIFNISTNNNNIMLMRLASAPNFVFDLSKLDEFLKRTRKIFRSACQRSIQQRLQIKAKTSVQEL